VARQLEQKLESDKGTEASVLKRLAKSRQFD